MSPWLCSEGMEYLGIEYGKQQFLRTGFDRIAADALFGNTFVLAHQAFVALDPLLAFSSAIATDGGALLSLLFGFHVDLDNGPVLALLVQGLVSPLALPLAGLLVEGKVAAGLGLRDGLLTGETGAWRWEGEQNTLGGRAERACGEKLVDERLGAVTGKFGEGLLEVLAVEGHWVGVLCEEMAKVESVWCRLFDCDGQLWLRVWERHCGIL
ncbi:hypothetical protein HG531_011969 [Fusarium graminearum]|nr:hypothetical protein HG531_011969 [Fusarium graminearum]